MVLIFNSTVSREISGTNFTRVRLQPNTREIYPEFHSYHAITYTYIYIYMYIRIAFSIELRVGG